MPNTMLNAEPSGLDAILWAQSFECEVVWAQERLGAKTFGRQHTMQH